MIESAICEGKSGTPKLSNLKDELQKILDALR